MLKSRHMYLDCTKAMRRLNLLNTVIMPAKIMAGLGAAGNRLMIDAVVQQDTVPIKRPGYGGKWTPGSHGDSYTASDRKAGELRASGAVFVDRKKTRSSQHYGEFATGKYQPKVYGGEPIMPLTHQAAVVFNAPYANIQHEQFIEKTEALAGRYYLSSKLYGNAVTYYGIIAKAIKL